MFFSVLSDMFGWLPLPLRGLIGVVFVFFAVFVAFSLIKMIWTLIEFIAGMLGGVLGKIVSLFM